MFILHYSKKTVLDEFRDIICFACSHFVFGAQCYMQAFS